MGFGDHESRAVPLCAPTSARSEWKAAGLEATIECPPRTVYSRSIPQ